MFQTDLMQCLMIKRENLVAADIFTLVYGSRYRKENYSCEALLGEACLVLYLNPESNPFFLPDTELAKQLTDGMTLRQGDSPAGQATALFYGRGAGSVCLAAERRRSRDGFPDRCQPGRMDRRFFICRGYFYEITKV